MPCNDNYVHCSNMLFPLMYRLTTYLLLVIHMDNASMNSQWYSTSNSSTLRSYGFWLKLVTPHVTKKSMNGIPTFVLGALVEFGTHHLRPLNLNSHLHGQSAHRTSFVLLIWWNAVTDQPVPQLAADLILLHTSPWMTFWRRSLCTSNSLGASSYLWTTYAYVISALKTTSTTWTCRSTIWCGTLATNGTNWNRASSIWWSTWRNHCHHYHHYTHKHCSLQRPYLKSDDIWLSIVPCFVLKRSFPADRYSLLFCCVQSFTIPVPYGRVCVCVPSEKK